MQTSLHFPIKQVCRILKKNFGSTSNTSLDFAIAIASYGTSGQILPKKIEAEQNCIEIDLNFVTHLQVRILEEFILVIVVFLDLFVVLFHILPVILVQLTHSFSCQGQVNSFCLFPRLQTVLLSAIEIYPL